MDDMITVAITGPIAPPIILISLVAAEDIPVSSLGVRAIIILISVTGKSAAPIPKMKSDAVTSAEVLWNIVTSKKDIDMITILGMSSIVLSLCFFASNNPKTGPNINTAKDKGSCNNPTRSASSPRPDP